MFLHISYCLTYHNAWFTVTLCMSQIVLYLLHSTLVLSFSIDAVLTLYILLSIKYAYMYHQSRDYDTYWFLGGLNASYHLLIFSKAVERTHRKYMISNIWYQKYPLGIMKLYSILFLFMSISCCIQCDDMCRIQNQPVNPKKHHSSPTKASYEEHFRLFKEIDLQILM